MVSLIISGVAVMKRPLISVGCAPSIVGHLCTARDPTGLFFVPIFNNKVISQVKEKGDLLIDDNYNIITETLHFEWSPEKSDINIKKHGIDFHEAASVFDDLDALVIPDPIHSETEERFIIMGLSFYARLLVVVHCTRGEDERIRLISARKATKNEHKQYSSMKTQEGRNER